MIDYEPPETLFLEEFEIAEDLLKQIIKCLPNTAPGFDNLIYDDLKRHLSLITPSLKTIFTICRRNKRVLSEIRKCGFWCKLPLFDHFCGAPTQ